MMPSHAQLLEAVTCRFEERTRVVCTPPAAFEAAQAQLGERFVTQGLTLLGGAQRMLAVLPSFEFIATFRGNQRKHAVSHGATHAISRVCAGQSAPSVSRGTFQATRFELSLSQVPEAKGQIQIDVTAFQPLHAIFQRIDHREPPSPARLANPPAKLESCRASRKATLPAGARCC